MEKKEVIKISTIHGTFETERVTPTYLRRKKWAPKNLKHVLSFIPGTVSELYVKEGDTVAEGDKLMTFKAMKMESVIYAEFSGKVDAILVEIGKVVPKGEVMIAFE